MRGRCRNIHNPSIDGLTNLPKRNGLDRFRDFVFRPFGIPDPTLPKPSPISESHAYSTISQNAVLFVKNPNRIDEEHGQGFFISDSAILTAGHVAEFYRQPKSDVRLRHNTELGPPKFGFNEESKYQHNIYQSASSPAEVDMGLITLKYPKTDKAKIKFLSADQVAGTNQITAISYWGRGGKNAPIYERQYKSIGRFIRASLTDTDNLRGAHSAPVYARWSGSPIFISTGDEHLMIGVHTSTIKIENLFCGITSDRAVELINIQKGNRPDPKLWRQI